MDIDQALSHARARFDHAAARRILREKYQAKLTFAHAGGMFRACPEMMVFLKLFANDEVVVQDLYANPVRVKASDLFDIMQSRWQEQMTAWHLEHEELSKQR